MEETTEKSNSGYGKRPLWQLVAIYLIVGAVVYGVIYYFFLAKKGSYNYDQTQSNTQQQYTPSTSTSQTSPTLAVQESQNTVTLSADSFSPETLSVNAGTKVTWANKSGSVASINSAIHPTHLVYPPLNFDGVRDGASATLIFDKPGTYKYHNHFNPSQKGVIIVQ